MIGLPVCVAEKKSWNNSVYYFRMRRSIHCFIFQEQFPKRLNHTRFTPHFCKKAPFIKNQYRNYLPIFPSAAESFDLQSYDLVISSSHCVAKGIIPSSSGIHLCYCHTPMRYIWSHYWDYFGDHRSGFVKRKTLPMVMSYLRMWDVSSTSRVDEFIANSKFIGERIQKYYGRTSQVVYPPVDVDFFVPSNRTREDFCLMVSALVPYKRLEVAIEAFRNSNRNLVIVGTGPEEKRLKKTGAFKCKILRTHRCESIKGTLSERGDVNSTRSGGFWY